MTYECDHEAIWNLLSEGMMDPLPDLQIGLSEHHLQEIMVEAGLPKQAAERILIDKNLREKIQHDLTEVCWRWLSKNAAHNYGKFLAPPRERPPVNPKASPRPGESQWSAS